jgi:hypothetical protein
MNSLLTKIFDDIRTNSILMRQDLPKMVAKLQSQANSESQGTGNKVTAQEASFASVLELNGIQFHPKDAPFPTNASLYYLYQPNGSQRSIDFRIFECDGISEKTRIDIDLKHTISDIFFLNDGWFHKDVIYMITWNRRTSLPRKKITSEPATFIGLGQDIPYEAETKMMNELIAIKKKINSEFKGVNSLCVGVRFANRYKCDRFTPEFTEECFKNVKLSLHSSSSSLSSESSPSTT